MSVAYATYKTLCVHLMGTPCSQRVGALSSSLRLALRCLLQLLRRLARLERGAHAAAKALLQRRLPQRPIATHHRLKQLARVLGARQHAREGLVEALTGDVQHREQALRRGGREAVPPAEHLRRQRGGQRGARAGERQVAGRMQRAIACRGGVRICPALEKPLHRCKTLCGPM